MANTEIVRITNSLVAWLDVSASGTLMRLLIKNDGGATQFLRALFPDLPEGLDLSDPSWREPMLDALEYRISPRDEDWERLPTELMPDYARFATDLRQGA